ncbi:L,D-transpeptidase [Candidatus Syntrophocurvum alkaliphilum]|uniref:L,D-transpeptidase n=1 Tax=Candidatus Syntrophocurvum alkaliphilum TaxID=2293317 RepID=A0A6I6DDN6_9FIRM|nr:peptidoglycan-binding protein [Candidatus Syntrophocurvum alkaliphilum]QGT98718.1 L,D-transpeptidase [Candidatus Syntrophocurvum alkaliphilum]
MARLITAITIAILCTFIFINDSHAQAIDRTDFPVLSIAEPAMQGDAVLLLQERLSELGHDIKPTSVFDSKTKERVKLFQIANSIEADGIVTQEVWELMFEKSMQPSAVIASDNIEEEQAKMLIEIDTVHKTLTVYKNGEFFKKYPCAVGKSKTPSPLGEWKIVHKGLNWGSGFGTRWMGLNVPWGIYGIHGTNKPGSIGTAASHGCIRMFNRDVEELYPQIPYGTRVRIVEDGKLFPGDFKPRKLTKKMSGQDVVYVQSQLKELGYVFDNADGRFGNMTEFTVKYYQAWNGLDITGEVTEEMYRSMGMID